MLREKNFIDTFHSSFPYFIPPVLLSNSEGDKNHVLFLTNFVLFLF